MTFKLLFFSYAVELGTDFLSSPNFEYTITTFLGVFFFYGVKVFLERSSKIRFINLDY